MKKKKKKTRKQNPFAARCVDGRIKVFVHGHARPFVGVFKGQSYKIFGKRGHFLPNVDKSGQTAPRTGKGYPHEGPFVVDFNRIFTLAVKRGREMCWLRVPGQTMVTTPASRG